MRITAKVDYAVRAGAELAAAQAAAEGTRAPMKGEAIATAQSIPMRFLESILAELRRSSIIGSQRGSDGGYWLARPAAEVSVADVIRAVEGPLADVHGTPPEEVTYEGAAAELQRVWIATRVALREVLETTSLADIASGALPSAVGALAARPDGWVRR
ncbi:MAG: RrF2 family transcriptional regulator [Acidimicrobiales bacterium]